MKEEGIVLSTLKTKYFELALEERFPDTPDITAELDALEKQIKEIKDNGR